MRSAIAWTVLLGACVDPEVDDLNALESEVLSLNKATTIANVGTLKCLDIPDAALGPSPVNQFACHGGTNQQFRFERHYAGGVAWTPYVKLVNVNSRLCVQPATYSPVITQGLPLRQDLCSDTSTFVVDRFVSTASGGRGALKWSFDQRFCLDVPYGSAADGLQVQLYACHGGWNQTFDLRQVQ